MDKKLRIIDSLENICEHNNVALEGDLICECGNHYFKIYHSGKQTKGIFAPYLIKKNHLQYCQFFNSSIIHSKIFAILESGANSLQISLSLSKTISSISCSFLSNND
jgi:hypothetical protein